MPRKKKSASKSESKSESESETTVSNEKEAKEVKGAVLNPQYDAPIESYKSVTPEDIRVDFLKKKMGVTKDNDLNWVGNVPEDRVTTWATDPRMDAGKHLSRVKGRGYREVRLEEVTANEYVTDKLYVRNYSEGPNGTVAMGGGVLMIGYRQYRDERERMAREQYDANLEASHSDLDARNIQVDNIGNAASIGR